LRVFRQLDQLPAGFGPTVVSIGNFDGVHRAHQHVLGRMRGRAVNAKSVAVTFEPHPVRILRPQAAPRLITPLAQKLELLSATGIDAVLVIPFTQEFSTMTPEQFAEQVVSRRLRAREVHEGSNFRFGHKAQGSVEDLSKEGKRLGFEVIVYPEMRIRGDVVSSSHIRELVSQGKVSRARCLLGRMFSITATPQRGRGYGSKYTVPTLNLGAYSELLPANGVYISRTRVRDLRFDSVTNVGNRPTFGEDSFAVESHLLRFQPFDITPDTAVEICFLHRLRPEIKFPSVEALRQQIGRDVARTERFFRLLP
jgi:riboflavin kinase / FMN adenylyltransferase